MRQLINIILKKWQLVGWVMILSLLVAFLETVGLTAVAPLLSGQNSPLVDRLPGTLRDIFLFINKMSLVYQLYWIAAVLLVSTLIKNFFIWCNIVCSSWLRIDIVKYYRMQCMNRLMRVGISYINDKRINDLQQIIDIHIDNSVGMIIESMVMVFPQIVTLVVLILFLFKLSMPLTVTALVLVFLSSMLLSFLAKQVRQEGAAYVEERFEFSQCVSDVLHGMKILRIFGKEQVMTNEFEGRCDKYHYRFAKMMQATAMIAPVFETCGIFILALLLFVSSFMVGHDPSAHELILLFLLIWVRIIPPVKALNSNRAAIVARIPALGEVDAFMQDTQEQIIHCGAIEFKQFQDKLKFENVIFRYSQNSPIVLAQVSFSLLRSQRLGIVGGSGSGKSTISELILHFYKPQEGRITVDGVNLNDLNIVSWRKAIGVVTQDTFLFHDTVRFNIAFGNPQATLEQIIQAAKRAHAHEFIEQLPQGYETRVGERGVLLSGGQRQRIAIARAILNEPQILIFDEATSALDSESEKHIQDAIQDISKDKTVILIAHRLSTLEGCDRILVLKDGRIVEEGTPRDLWNSDSYFRRMSDIQGVQSFK